MSADASHDSVLEFAAQIVSAHVSNNSVQASALPDLIQQVYKALTMVGTEPAPAEKLEPAVPLKKSVFPDYIVCLEDGKKLKMLKRHLMTSYGMTPEAYRERWGLPSNYPMVAPSYAERRSALAKSIGLGRKPSAVEASAAIEEPGEPPAAKPARRGRKPGRPAAEPAG
jgi:predicted transcriptional regulator